MLLLFSSKCLHSFWLRLDTEMLLLTAVLVYYARHYIVCFVGHSFELVKVK